MMLNKLPINSRVSVEVERDKKRFEFSSLVQDIETGGVRVLAPSEITLHAKEEVGVLYCTDSGKLIRWDAVYGGKVSDNIALVRLLSDKQGYTYNRRDAFRLGVYLKKELKLGRGSTSKGFIKDISETGVGVLLDEYVDVGETIEFDVEHNKKKIFVKAVVIRYNEINYSGYRYSYGCKIVKEIGSLHSFILDKQREIMKNRIQ